MRYLLLLLVILGAHAQDAWFARVCRQTLNAPAPDCRWARLPAGSSLQGNDADGYQVVLLAPTTNRPAIRYAAWLESDVLANRTQDLPSGATTDNIVAVSHGGVLLTKVGPSQVAQCGQCYAIVDRQILFGAQYTSEPGVGQAFVATYIIIQ